MKKITRIIALIIVCLVGSCAASEGMSLFRKSTREFRFEDYETNVEAQEALLKLHPVGTNVDLLEKTLKKAGAIYKPITNPVYKDKAEYKNIVIYEYRVGLLKWNGWNVDIRQTDEKKIHSFKIYRTYQGL